MIELFLFSPDGSTSAIGKHIETRTSQVYFFCAICSRISSIQTLRTTIVPASNQSSPRNKSMHPVTSVLRHNLPKAPLSWCTTATYTCKHATEKATNRIPILDINLANSILSYAAQSCVNCTSFISPSVRCYFCPYGDTSANKAYHKHLPTSI